MESAKPLERQLSLQRRRLESMFVGGSGFRSDSWLLNKRRTASVICPVHKLLVIHLRSKFERVKNPIPVDQLNMLVEIKLSALLTWAASQNAVNVYIYIYMWYAPHGP